MPGKSSEAFPFSCCAPLIRSDPPIRILITFPSPPPPPPLFRIFGGSTLGLTLYNDLVVLEPATGELRVVAPMTEVVPAPRYSHAAAFARSADESRLIVIGGALGLTAEQQAQQAAGIPPNVASAFRTLNPMRMTNDVWQFSLEHQEWTLLSPAQSILTFEDGRLSSYAFDVPPPFADHTITIVDSTVYIIGGRSDMQQFLTSVYTFDLQTRTFDRLRTRGFTGVQVCSRDSC